MGLNLKPIVEGGRGYRSRLARKDAVAYLPPTYIFAVLNAAAPPFDDIHFRRAAIRIRLTTFASRSCDEDARLRY